MYDTNYKCIYYKEDLFVESDNLNEENKNMIRDDLYKNDLLNIFMLDEYDDEKISLVLDDLHEKIISNEILKEYMIRFAFNYFMENNTKFSIIFLFSFDSLYLFHPCICDYLVTGSITEINLNKLNSKVNNKENNEIKI